MLDAAFHASPLPGLILWAILYTSDLLLTMTCARLYQNGARQFVVFEGSYEITPYYQDDVDRLRVFSPRFFAALAATCGVQLLMWYLTMRALMLPDVYVFALGAMILVELTIHIRHVRNLFLFRALVSGHGITGRIEYPRPIMLRLSAMEILSFAILYMVLYVITESWFLLGGATACVSLAINHRKLAGSAARTVGSSGARSQ
jgi:hypothetical protein